MKIKSGGIETETDSGSKWEKKPSQNGNIKTAEAISILWINLKYPLEGPIFFIVVSIGFFLALIWWLRLISD